MPQIKMPQIKMPRAPNKAPVISIYAFLYLLRSKTPII